MVSVKLRSINTALGGLLGKVSPDSAEILRLCRRNLDDAIDRSEALEEGLTLSPDAGWPEREGAGQHARAM